MANFSVAIPELGKLQSLLKKFPQTTEKYLQRAIDASADDVFKNATRTNVPWKTGNLVQSFGVVRGRLVALVGPNKSGVPAKYAIFVHEGTAPHVITPKKGKALFWKGAKHPVKSIKHPGTKPNRFIPRILEKSMPRIQTNFQTALAKIIQETTDL